MHLAVVGEDPDLQVMHTIDVLADFQYERHRIGRSQVGRDDFGDLVADGLGNPWRLPIPAVDG